MNWIELYRDTIVVACDEEGGEVTRILYPKVTFLHTEKNGRDLYAARAEGMGLTTYGYTTEEAEAALEDLIETFVDHYTRYDRIDQILANAAVRYEKKEYRE